MLDLTFVLQCQFELQYCLYRKVRGTDINDIRCKSFAGLKICSFVTLVPQQHSMFNKVSNM